MGLLDKIDSPADLKKIPRDALPALAEEIRDSIVRVVSRTGGHLASSLGTVELAIAIHYVFDIPTDSVIWDVGHQSYAHKLLTGRRRQFDTLRQHGGISGFTRMSESPFDAFSTGHSSTSISAGLGMSCAQKLKNEAGKVIAVIGDGSLTAGLAYEGLNQAGDTPNGKDEKKDLIVILNDNDMSIAENVGALSSFLSRTLSAKRLQEWRKELGGFLKSLPKFGGDIYQLAKRSEGSFKTFITPGMLFEAFNFTYFGPINGHRMGHLIDILNNIKHLDGPVLLHVTTRKGRGYPPAEENPVYFHGCGSFEIETGSCISRANAAPSYTEVFGQTMIALAQRDERIVAVTAAMPEGTGLAEFGRRFPERFFDVGIAEQHGVTFAAGMAAKGMRPVVAVYSTFLQRAYDQILHDVCLENLPVIFAIDRGGIVGEDGPTHHGLFDLSYLRSIPNMTVMAPKDENELAAMLVTALKHDGPSAIRYPRGAALGVPLDDDPSPLPLGQAELLCKGKDVILVGYGSTVAEAAQAATRLREENIEATVVNARFLKPLDTGLFTSLCRETPRIVTVEENVRMGGFGSAILETLADSGVSHFQIRRIGLPDRFIEHGAQKLLRSRYGIGAEAIAAAARDLVTVTAKG